MRSNAFGLVWWLLDKGAKIGSEIGDDDCIKILFEAIKRDDLDVVELLLKRGAHLLKNDYGEIALHVAAKYGSADAVKRLLDIGADLSARDLFGYTPLHKATMAARSEIVSILLDFDSDVHDSSNDRVLTPLHLAVSNKDIDTTVILLKHGASVSAVAPEKYTPIHLAARCGSADILDKLLNYVKQPSDLDLRNKDGDTALHIAIGENSLAKVAMLLNNEADLLATNTRGKSPIHIAAQCATAYILDTLLNHLEQPSDLILRDTYGDTPLHLAVESSSSTKVAALLERGGGLLVTNALGRTPIHSAAKYSTPEILDMLLGYRKQTFHPDLRDTDGNTALHLAIEVENSDKAKMLLKKGANFTILNSVGESALVMALSSNEKGIRELGRQCQESLEMGRFSIVF